MARAASARGLQPAGPLPRIRTLEWDIGPCSSPEQTPLAALALTGGHALPHAPRLLMLRSYRDARTKGQGIWIAQQPQEVAGCPERNCCRRSGQSANRIIRQT